MLFAFSFNLSKRSVFAYTYSLNSCNFYKTSILCSCHSRSILVISISVLLFDSCKDYYAI